MRELRQKHMKTYTNAHTHTHTSHTVQCKKNQMETNTRQKHKGSMRLWHICVQFTACVYVCASESKQTDVNHMLTNTHALEQSNLAHIHTHACTHTDKRTHTHTHTHFYLSTDTHIHTRTDRETHATNPHHSHKHTQNQKLTASRCGPSLHKRRYRPSRRISTPEYPSLIQCDCNTRCWIECDIDKVLRTGNNGYSAVDYIELKKGMSEYAHNNTHTHTQTQTHTNTHRHARTTHTTHNTHIQTDRQTDRVIPTDRDTHTHHTQKHTHTRTQAQAHIHTHTTHTSTHTHAHKHKHTHIHTHAYTHTRTQHKQTHKILIHKNNTDTDELTAQKTLTHAYTHTQTHSIHTYACHAHTHVRLCTQKIQAYVLTKAEASVLSQSKQSHNTSQMR